MNYPASVEQQIRLKAYFIWEFRMEFNIIFVSDELGNLRYITAQDDWLQAEDEVLTNLHLRR